MPHRNAFGTPQHGRASSAALCRNYQFRKGQRLKTQIVLVSGLHGVRHIGTGEGERLNHGLGKEILASAFLAVGCRLAFMSKRP